MRIAALAIPADVQVTVRLAPALALTALVLALAACSSAAPTVAPDASPSTRVEVRLTDALRIEPSPLLVPAAVPVTFVVTNAGVLDHELFFGDEGAQEQHQQEVAQAGGIAHDGPNGIALRPGETREFTFTFEAGAVLLAGCHLPGHYPAGMKAEVVVR